MQNSDAMAGKLKHFRIGDHVKATDKTVPGWERLTYTVVQVGYRTVDIEDINGNRHCVKPFQIELTTPEWREEEHKGRIDVKEAEEAMYYHTKKGGEVMYVIVASVMAVYLITGIGHVAVVLAMATLVLSIMQNLWQGVMLELFVRELDREGQHDFDEYPDRISNGSWVIYAVKMVIAVMAAVQLMIEVW